MWLLWLILVVIFSLTLYFTKNKIAIWFIISSLMTFVLTFFINDFYLTFLCFGILSITLLLLSKTIIKAINIDNNVVSSKMQKEIAKDEIKPKTIKKGTKTGKKKTKT